MNKNNMNKTREEKEKKRVCSYVCIVCVCVCVNSQFIPNGNMTLFWLLADTNICFLYCHYFLLSNNYTTCLHMQNTQIPMSIK